MMIQTKISFGVPLRYRQKPSFSFGSPTGQIAIVHKDMVDNNNCIEEDHFLQGLNFWMLPPGLEAQRVAIYIGWLVHGTKGGIVADVLFALPSVFLLWGLSWLYAAFANVPAVVLYSNDASLPVIAGFALAGLAWKLFV
jgi:chromate transporter